MKPLGLLVNPRSGKDVRRVVAAAATSTLEDKISIIRRVIQGASTAGVTKVVTNREPHRLVERAVGNRADVTVDYLGTDLAGNETDSIVVAGGLRDAECPAVIVLGGDGTNRAVALGWPEVPVVPLSTGTNNAFPYYVEPTVAGAAAGLIVTERVDRAAVSTPAKVVRVDHPSEADVPDGDLALIDAVAVDDPYVGSLELFDPVTMRAAMLTRADPSAIGFSSIGGLLEPVTADDPDGLYLRFTTEESEAQHWVQAPTAPGHHSWIGIAEARRVACGEPVEVPGPLLLAFDGERKRRIHAGETATLHIERDGPLVIDVRAVMAQAAATGMFVRDNR